MHTFKIDGLDDELRVVRFDGHEGLSQLYEFEITFAAGNDLALSDLVGRPALLTFRVGEEPRHVHGLLASVEQGDEGKRLTSYRAVLVPEVWRLRHRRDSRIFQDLSVPDILQKVLDGARLGSGYRLSLSGSYAPRLYCVQYRESDWDFLSRLMEEEGITTWFEHSDGEHVLMITDHPAAHPPIPGQSTLVFRPPLGALVAGEHVSRLHIAERVRPGKVTLRDFNFKKPNLLLEGAEQASLDDDLEIYDYPGVYEEPGPGRAYAKIRLEEFQVARRSGDGESACPRFAPGHRFTLAEHARDDVNTEYLLVRVDHHGAEPNFEQAGGGAPYGNRFHLIPAEIPFRPARVTPRPTVRGVQTAIVTGPSGEEIYTDEHGRIKVQFHWDRTGKKDEKSSCWIRVSQPWAGGAWGAVFLPRIGHEVVVDFIEGDPDRPLVVGSVYHGANVPPYPLPAEKTKSTIKSNSSKGGGGFNELRFEDKKGQEEIFLHGQKDWNILIENDKAERVVHDETLLVGHDRDKRVDNDESESIGGHKFIEVARTHTESVGEDASITIGGNLTEGVAKNHVEAIAGSQSVNVGDGQDTTVGQSMSLSVGQSMSISVGDSKSESVGASSSETVAKSKSTSVDENYAITVSKDMTVTIGKNAKDEVGEKKTLIVGKELAIQVGDAQIVIKKNGDITVQGKNITVKGKGPIQVQGKKIEVKSDGDVDVKASGKVKVKGSNVGLN
ncbi:type VI secretion system Vgr family protein [Chondromyces crocatus]|uniref:Type VI secretion protein VgrG n=1 Tax=Chondromyces crocatus TaxID=52 RepID=A0A0K1E7Q3_CHOCO|nr:type VI secretion system tip protein TssI/VgrG [Chondromyces crocatus]AKT36916.1 type VI secretion protein VgrG [Chondromyces crocatus]